jgi:hypothetical protein
VNKRTGWLFLNLSKFVNRFDEGIFIPVDLNNYEELKVWLETAYVLGELPKIGDLQYE